MINFPEMNHEIAETILMKNVTESVKEFYDTPYQISEDLIKFYQTNGFVKIEKVLSGESLEFTKRLTEASVLLRKEHDKRTLAEKSEYEQSFLQCGFLCFDFPAMMDLISSKRLAGIARDLMKVSGVRLWHDQALFKEPGGRHTDVHQDSSYWPLQNPEKSITIWIALNDVPLDKGSLYFYPGTHLSGVKEYVDIFKNPHNPQFLESEKIINVPLTAGDATFHSGLTFHGANPNKTNEVREAMTIIYIDENSRFDDSDKRNATHKSCSGLLNGEIISTKFTPKLI